MTTTKPQKRLSRNFHNTFKPERHYINALLRFAASGQRGDFQEIADITGIPMGKSSGKVPAIIEYCKGMGLIEAPRNLKTTAKKNFELTEFGRIVLFEDPFMKNEVTQWIAHFNLCNPIFGADIWYFSFFLGTNILGDKHKRIDLEKYLSLQYGLSERNLIGPLIGMYEDEAAFNLCAAVSESNGVISRREAPVVNEFGRGYGAWMIQMINDYFPKQQQVPVSDLDKMVGWKTIPRWFASSSALILDLIESKGLVNVDRHMEPWLIQPRVSPKQAWKDIFNDMI